MSSHLYKLYRGLRIPSGDGKHAYAQTHTHTHTPLSVRMCALHNASVKVSGLIFYLSGLITGAFAAAWPHPTEDTSVSPESIREGQQQQQQQQREKEKKPQSAQRRP